MDRVIAQELGFLSTSLRGLMGAETDTHMGRFATDPSGAFFNRDALLEEVADVRALLRQVDAPRKPSPYTIVEASELLKGVVMEARKWLEGPTNQSLLAEVDAYEERKEISKIFYDRTGSISGSLAPILDGALKQLPQPFRPWHECNGTLPITFDDMGGRLALVRTGEIYARLNVLAPSDGVQKMSLDLREARGIFNRRTEICANWELIGDKFCAAILEAEKLQGLGRVATGCRPVSAKHHDDLQIKINIILNDPSVYLHFPREPWERHYVKGKAS